MEPLSSFETFGCQILVLKEMVGGLKGYSLGNAISSLNLPPCLYSQLVVRGVFGVHGFVQRKSSRRDLQAGRSRERHWIHRAV